MRLIDSERPPCYLPEKGEFHPLCIGRGFANCARCHLWADFDEDLDETAVNPPLTLEKLREMDGEPVWVVEGTLSYHALMSGVFDAVIWLIARWGEREMRAEGYGKTWLVYRRKPEEGAP